MDASAGRAGVGGARTWVRPWSIMRQCERPAALAAASSRSSSSVDCPFSAIFACPRCSHRRTVSASRAIAIWYAPSAACPHCGASE